MLLVCEDLHWIDAETQALLDSLVESLSTAQLLLLVNYRPDYQHGWGSKVYYTQLRLDPLPPASAGVLLCTLLGDDPSLASLTQLLITRAKGNPFFLEESVPALVETGALIGESGAYQLAQALPTIHVPATVQAVLAARIDRLPAEEKRLLQTAAVIGMEVPLPLLQTVAVVPETALQRGLAQLQAAEFLYETRLFPERAYSFKHALTQEVAYHSLLTSRQQALHEAIGSAIEALYSERIDEQYELLARHFTRSSNAAKALHYLAIAGQRAVRLFAYEQAVAFFQEALARIEGLSDRETLQRREVEILLDLELVYDNLARRDEQRRLLERLIQAAEALGDPALLSDAHIRKSEFMSVVGAVEDALADAERALGLKRRAGDQRGEAKALRAMGFIYWQLRRYEDALNTHREALRIHREVGDRVAASVELFNLGEILRQLQQYQDALRCLEEARQILSALEDPLGLALCYYNIGNVYRDLGELGTALRYYQQTLASRSRLPHGESTLWCAPFMGIATIHSQLGDHRTALQYYREALAISRRLGDHRDTVAPLQALAATHEILGEVSDALASYQEALTLSRELGDRQAERSILTCLGHLNRMQRRDFPAALACYQQSLAISRETGEEDERLTALKGLGATYWNVGLYEEAVSTFEQALVIVETKGDRAELAVIRSSLGVTALSLHRYETALAHLQDGLAIAKALGDPQAEGYIMNVLGNVYYEVGNQRRAKDCYQQAVRLRRRLRDRKGEGWSLHYLGRSHAEVGEIEEARGLQEQVLNLADKIGDAELQARAQIALSTIHCRLGGRGAVETSLRYAQQAVELSRENGLHRAENVGLSQRAMALLHLNNVEDARTCSEEAVKRLGEVGGPADEREWIWLHHAQILRVCGQDKLADRYLRRAYEGVMERLATVWDVGVRKAMLNARLLREIMSERAKGGPHDVTISG